jgi:hypothetical protein
MSIGLWLIVLLGMFLAGVGGWLVAHGLFSDRLARQGVRRRCPKCWYDMRAVAGLQCPECGLAARSERALAKSRVRRRWVLGGAVVMLLGLGHVLGAVMSSSAWVSLVPRGVLARYWSLVPREWPKVEKQVYDATYTHIANIGPGDASFAEDAWAGIKRAIERAKLGGITSRLYEQSIGVYSGFLLRSGLATFDDLFVLAGYEGVGWRGHSWFLMEERPPTLAWTPRDVALASDALTDADQERARLVAWICLVSSDAPAVVRRNAVAFATRTRDPKLITRAIESWNLGKQAACEFLDQVQRDDDSSAASERSNNYVPGFSDMIRNIDNRKLTLEGQEMLGELLTSSNWRTRDAAVSLLDGLDIEPFEAHVLAGLVSGDAEVRESTASLFGRTPDDKPLSQRVALVLFELLNDTNPRVASHASSARGLSEAINTETMMRGFDRFSAEGQGLLLRVLVSRVNEGLCSHEVLKQVAENQALSAPVREEAARFYEVVSQRSRVRLPPNAN